MDPSQFEAQKDTSLAHQIIKAGRLINARGLATLREAFGLPALKQSHLDLLPHIDFAGTPITEIARRKGVSKQLVSKQVAEMVAMGLLHTRTDPADNRSKRVFFHTSGPASIERGFGVLLGLDHLLANALGKREYDTMVAGITRVVALFGGAEEV